MHIFSFQKDGISPVFCILSENEEASIPDMNNVSLSLNIPTVSPIQSYEVARVGIRIDGVKDMIFSSVKKLAF